ncbi:hypothetical protein E2C01_022897 [Portunus trituberculatus]|uniref:Uncharacterized protein n=1 Tax=Portunus trituberculatus TaxID=210409 RepID=A0A5B7E9R1_PORTR|nr:hypothetical protein [Portunus trituberculatus]
MEEKKKNKEKKGKNQKKGRVKEKKNNSGHFCVLPNSRKIPSHGTLICHIVHIASKISGQVIFPSIAWMTDVPLGLPPLCYRLQSPASCLLLSHTSLLNSRNCQTVSVFGLFLTDRHSFWCENAHSRESQSASVV